MFLWRELVSYLLGAHQTTSRATSYATKYVLMKGTSVNYLGPISSQVKQLIMDISRDWIMYPLGSPCAGGGVQWMCNHSVNEKLWTQFILNNYKSQIILTMYHIQRVLFWSKFLHLVEIFGHLCFSVWFRPNFLFSFTSFASFYNLTIFFKKKLLNS
jgi:hypothetical protein